MFKALFRHAVVVSALLTTTTSVYAHGGTYRGPGDTVPPGSGGIPSKPPSPSPGVPTPPGGRGGVPTPGTGGTGGLPPGTGNGGLGGITPGMLQGVDLSSWTFWWSFNRDKYLQLKVKIAAQNDVLSGDGTGDLLRGKMDGSRESLRPSARQISQFAVPALKQALDTENNRDIVSGSLIALAKIGDDPDQVIRYCKKWLTSKDQELSETAALALGILAAPEAMSILIDLVHDTESGRQSVGQPEVPWRTRSFALYGLGLTAAGNPTVQSMAQQVILDYLENEGSRRAPHRDLRVAAVISLGLIPDPERRAVAGLQAYFKKNEAREEIICAHIPNSIARLLAGAPAAERQAQVEAYLAVLAEPHKSKGAEIRRSMAQAVGMLTDGNDSFAQKCVEVLKDKIDNEVSKNNILAYFSLISLGQINGSLNVGSDIDKYLLSKAQAQGGRVMTRAWAALALGVDGFAKLTRKASPVSTSDLSTTGDLLLTAMASIKDPEQLSAYAIGLGLMRHEGSKGHLRKLLFEEIKADTYRGYFATALGLLGDTNPGTLQQIKDLVENSTRRPELLRECAMSLGLLGDKRVVDTLLGLLGNPENRTLAVQAAIATALGFVGDYRAIENSRGLTLPAMLIDPKRELPAESRAFAAVALGLVCDKEELPWNFKIASDLNYTATTPTLNDQVSQTGILNLL